jgi:hypothetical protein
MRTAGEVTDSFPAHYVAMGKTRIRYISAVVLLLGVIIGGALVALLLRPLVHRPPAESTEITQAIQDLQAGQRKAANQLQAIQQVLGADHDQVKQLSGQVPHSTINSNLFGNLSPVGCRPVHLRHRRQLAGAEPDKVDREASSPPQPAGMCRRTARHDSAEAAGESRPRRHVWPVSRSIERDGWGVSSALGMVFDSYFPARLRVLMLSNPLERVIFRNKALDYFRFTIGP